MVPRKSSVLLALALLACPAGSASVDAETDAGTSDSSESGTDTGDGDGEPLPDIDVLVTADLVEDSLWTTTENFETEHCAVAEGCVEQSGERRLLRFSTYTPNVGLADFVVGSPELEPELFEWDDCHEHVHFEGYADYRLLDTRGILAASGHKMAFSLFDLAPWVLDAGPATYPLADGTQGISVGWVDAYVSQLDCQWIDVTGVPAGDYQLEIAINPEQRIAESDYTNNLLRLPVTLTDTDSGPPGPPDDWSCSLDAYGSNGTCDCGCGAFDPNCANPTLAACEACNLPGSCAEGDPDCSSIAPNNNSTCE